MKYAYVANFIHPDVKLYHETKKKQMSLLSPEMDLNQRREVQNWLNQNGLPFMFSGVYNWSVIFEGPVLNFRDTPISEYEKYDVIHLNLFHQNFSLVKQVRDTLSQVGSKAKLVVNLDYSADLWHTDPRMADADALWAQLDYADVIFSVEEKQKEIIEYVLQRPVSFCPHPVDVDALRLYVCGGKKHGFPLKQRQWQDNTMGIREALLLVNLHRWEAVARGTNATYEGNVPYVNPALVVHRPRGKKLPCRALLSNIPKHMVEQVGTLWGGSHNVLVNDIHPLRFLSTVASCRAVLDVYSLSSYGRFSAETAALGVPTVGNGNIGSMKRCWPNLITDYYDLNAQHELLKRLLTDEDFWKDQVEYAAKAVEYYGYGKSRERFLKMLDD